MEQKLKQIIASYGRGRMKVDDINWLICKVRELNGEVERLQALEKALEVNKKRCEVQGWGSC